MVLLEEDRLQVKAGDDTVGQGTPRSTLAWVSVWTQLRLPAPHWGCSSRGEAGDRERQPWGSIHACRHTHAHTHTDLLFW